MAREYSSVSILGQSKKTVPITELFTSLSTGRQVRRGEFHYNGYSAYFLRQAYLKFYFYLIISF